LAIRRKCQSRRGALWETYRRNYGQEGDPLILVAQGASRDFNPNLPEEEIQRALERDPEANRAEYLAQFRADVESLLTQEAVGACVDAGVKERPFDRRNSYIAFCDPSGGSSDSTTLGIAHKEGETVVLDSLRECRPPFSPETVCPDYASVIKKYRCSQTFGDRYAGEWVVEGFHKYGIHYEECEQTRTELYLNMVPLINSGSIALLDNERMMLQLVSLERKISSVKDRVDHPVGMHDDLANAAAGAIVMAQQGSGYSAQQSFQDNLKMAQVYKKWARSVA
jgi:hypothetical protein